MPLVTGFVLAVGLSMDAAAVSAARGAHEGSLGPKKAGSRLRGALSVALFFGGFQALMPLLGWLLGDQLGGWVAAWDHWIAFVLLGGIGLKMLYEARSHDEDDAPKQKDDPYALRDMLVLAIATSIDAFAAGITLPMLDLPMALSVAMIGVTTAVLSILGLELGRTFGARLGKRFEIFGGLVLIGLGVKTLIEHLGSK
ncbi:MAG: manganese efflux pump [Labilithrix sp.]|nr:manganese efflux pump [Labilithrix sp.]